MNRDFIPPTALMLSLSCSNTLPLAFGGWAFGVESDNRGMFTGPVDFRVGDGDTGRACEGVNAGLNPLPYITRDKHESVLVRGRSVQLPRDPPRGERVNLLSLLAIKAGAHTTHK